MFECLPACCMHACRLRPPCSACSSAPRGAPTTARSATLLSCSPPGPGHGWRAQPLHPRAPVATPRPARRQTPTLHPAPRAATRRWSTFCRCSCWAARGWRTWSWRAAEACTCRPCWASCRRSPASPCGTPRRVRKGLPTTLWVPRDGLSNPPALAMVAVRDAQARSLGSSVNPLGSEGPAWPSCPCSPWPPTI